jgi:hypothetical protein
MRVRALLVIRIVASFMLSACCGASVPRPEPTDTLVPLPSANVQIIVVDKSAEYVDIENQDDREQDLEGWTLVSVHGNQLCALSDVIGPGEVLCIWALAQDADEDGHNCGFDANIWVNSEEDPAVLYDGAGQEISRY